ncbi:MAG: xylose isomerase [Candidatus Hydrogenedentota bacterium]
MSSTMNRRHFLQTGALAAGATATVPAMAQSVEQPKYQNGTSPWPLCMNTSTIRPATLEQKVEASAKAGYDAMELWVGDLEEYEKAGNDVKALGQRIKDHGMFVIDVIGLWDCLPPTQEEYDAIMPTTRKRMELSAAVGSKHVATLPLPNRDTFDMAWATEKYRELLNIGRNDYGILPSFEFVSLFKTVFKMGQAACIAIDANDPDASIVADTFHMHKGGGGFEGVRHLDGRFISTFHWNDVAGDLPPAELGDKDRILPGDGILPLKSVLQQLKDIGYTGPISLELFNRTHWEMDPNEVAVLGIESMRKQVAEFV